MSKQSLKLNEKNVGAGPVYARKNNNGITLIALIITIIVMLILVGVTVTVALNGGLFSKAKQAKWNTENAMIVEQKLSNGKIKIGDDWYLSYQDYLNNNPIITGIELSTETINLKKKESEDALGEQVLTGTVTARLFGMDEEPEITWEVSPAEQTAITLNATTGKEITVTAVGTESATIELTAKCIYEGTEYTEKCTVTLKMLKPIAKGSFVEYGVAYKDAYYTDYSYSTTNGWRLLDYTYDEETKTYSNVKLISTGIPAKLYYNYRTTINNDWWVEEETVEDESAPSLTKFRDILGGEEYYTFYTEDSTYYGLQAASGMYYNFGEIKFAYSNGKREENLGHFESITVYEETEDKSITYDANKADEKNGNELFKVRDDVSVRLLTLPEMNKALGRTAGADNNVDKTTTISTTEDSIGLYRLDQLKNVEGMSRFDYSSGAFWLASPHPSTSHYYHVCYFRYSGSYGIDGNESYGIRPLICLSSTIQFVDSNSDGTLEITVVQ